MEEVLGSQSLSLDDAFPNLSESAKMCKNCFKVYDNLFKKCSKLKQKLTVSARRACDLSELGLPPTPPSAATPVAAPATLPVTPSRKRRNEDDLQLQMGPIQKRRTSQDAGSPSVVVSD